MLSPQGAISVLRRPLLKSEKWRTRHLALGIVSVIGMFQQLAKSNVEGSFRINYDALIRGPNDR